MRAFSGRSPGIVAGAVLALLGGCGAAESSPSSPWSPSSREAAAPAPVPVVASTNVYGDVAKQIGGDRVKVVSIINDPAQDPHEYEAETRNQLELSRAKIVVENGGGYDDFMGEMLRGANNSSAEVITGVEASGKVPDDGGEYNEHVWYDMPTMGRLAERVADALAQAAPTEADAFRKNATDFKADLDTVRAAEARIEKERGGTAVAVTEPVPLYMVEACGLRNVTPPDFSEAVEEGDEVSARVLRETLGLVADGTAEALVLNEQTPTSQTERVERTARDNGVPVVTVTETLPSGQDYVAWMTANVDALRRALDT
ncbi:metal ABC transporter solute-binding protein, Zn/Mn family [Streptomyces sp. NRRL S-455]|uniref:metal ABC transporter solute-binding protein, Zn/Mn family n=1 Tax=Streptomyces sp. NRRL S-455 TaxID=1463908 RepID=UPI0004C09B30|nr:zinc ABC transporter substrate-binding protein [Streptomyces sp. NRRL S-455]